MENLPEQFKHIKGWGIDANDKNEPTYPMKNYTGDDHKRLNWERPEQQPLKEEILYSIERPYLPAVFGTSVPPSGLSGAIRRLAFKYSEGSFKHWLPLLLADRINMIEGVLSDFAHGRVPNVFAEWGWKSEWRHRPARLIAKIMISSALAAGVIALLYYYRSRKRL